MSNKLVKHSKKRFTSMVQDKPLHSSFEKKMEIKAQRQMVKLEEDVLKKAKLEQLLEKKRRRDENKKKREENAKKAEIVQHIKNTGKLKRKSKKEMRKLRKVP